MRDHVRFLVNGRPHAACGAAAFASATDFLRGECGLPGTKVVCAEGDCGACTVLVGRAGPGGVEYLPVDSCIQFLYQLDGTHVVTVEGLAGRGELHPVQRAMVECHGSQCGYCTPGFVMALAGWAEAGATADARIALTGNLCRCTGYLPILEAAGRIAGSLPPRIADRPDAEAIHRELRKWSAEPLTVTDGRRTFFAPTALTEAVTFKAAHPSAVVVGGGTELGVLRNKRDIDPDFLLSLARIPGLDRIEVTAADQTRHDIFGPDHPPPVGGRVGPTESGRGEGNGQQIPSPRSDLRSARPSPQRGEGVPIADHLPEATAASAPSRRITIGANATWSAIEREVVLHIPAFGPIVRRFGSPQIRNVSTLAGNIVNGSPIADSLPLLLVLDAEIELAGPGGTRRRPLHGFYTGYKQKDMAANELLTRVAFTLLAKGERLRCYKVSRRTDLDIATFGAAIRMSVVNDVIQSAAVAYSGVAATVLRLPTVEAVLTGKPFREATFRAAGEAARAAVQPLTDVRGGAAYRGDLAANILMKFFFKEAEVA